MHVIRLRARWELLRGNVMEQLGDRDTSGAGLNHTIVSLPFDCGATLRDSDVAGGAALQRMFHRPTGITPLHRVTLAVQHRRLTASVWLNRSLLGHTSDGDPEPRWDITARLDDFNRLAVVLSVPWSPSAVLESVVLEIDNDGHDSAGPSETN